MRNKIINETQLASSRNAGLMSAAHYEKLENLQDPNRDDIMLCFNVASSTTDIQKIFVYAKICAHGDFGTIVYSCPTADDILVYRRSGIGALSDFVAEFTNMTCMFPVADLSVAHTDLYGNPSYSKGNYIGLLTELQVVAGNPLTEMMTTGIKESARVWNNVGKQGILDELFSGWLKTRGILIMHTYDSF